MTLLLKSMSYAVQKKSEFPSLQKLISGPVFHLYDVWWQLHVTSFVYIQFVLSLQSAEQETSGESSLQSDVKHFYYGTYSRDTSYSTASGFKLKEHMRWRNGFTKDTDVENWVGEGFVELVSALV